MVQPHRPLPGSPPPHLSGGFDPPLNSYSDTLCSAGTTVVHTDNNLAGVSCPQHVDIGLSWNNPAVIKVNADPLCSGVRRDNVFIAEVCNTIRENRLVERKTLLPFIARKWLLLSHLLTLFSFSLNLKYLLYR